VTLTRFYKFGLFNPIQLVEAKTRIDAN